MSTFSNNTITIEIATSERDRAENLKTSRENMNNNELICVSNVEYSLLPLIEEKKIETVDEMQIISYEQKPKFEENKIYILEGNTINLDGYNLSKKVTCMTETEISPHDLSMKKSIANCSNTTEKPKFNKILKCENCIYLTFSKENLELHQLEKHSKTFPSRKRKEMACFGCDNIFLSKKSFKAHLLYDHQITPAELQLFLKNLINDKFMKKNDSSKIVQLNSSKKSEQKVLKVFKNESIISFDSSFTETSNKRELIASQSLGTKLSNILIADMNVNSKGTNVNSIKKEVVKVENDHNKLKKIKETKLNQLIDKEPKIFKCRFQHCNARLKTQANLEYHLKSHSQNGFLCPECPTTFPVWNTLRGHLWRKHKIDVELYACDKCDYKTFCLSQLNNIHRRIHNDIKSFLCDICAKAFKNPKQLLAHKTIHKPSYKKCNFTCDICNRPFASRRLLKLHVEGVHQQLKRFLCNYCGYKANLKSAVQLHERKHTGHKPYECELCNYTTADHNSLRRHKYKHNGEYSYKCPYCSYACIQSSTFKIHVRTKHPNIENAITFSCKYCNFKSLRKENYLTHLAKHELEPSTAVVNQIKTDKVCLNPTKSNVNVLENKLVQNSDAENSTKLDLYRLLINTNKSFQEIRNSTSNKHPINNSKFLFVSTNELSSNLESSNTTYVLDSSLVSCIYS